MAELEITESYSLDLKHEEAKKQKCPDDRSQCFKYADVVPNPRLNNQSDNVNKNRWHRAKRYNKTYPPPEGYFHTGVDILADSGTIIYSLLCGEVVKVVNSFSPNEYKANNLGNLITIKSKDKDGKDVWIMYCHLDGVSVKKGDKVKHGDAIGVAGSTGNAASVYVKGNLKNGIEPKYRHIHIEASTDGVFYGGKTRIDPEQFMKTKFDETTKGNPIPSEEEEIETVENEVEKRIRERELEKIKQPVDNLRIEKRPLPLDIKKSPKL